MNILSLILNYPVKSKGNLKKYGQPGPITRYFASISLQSTWALAFFPSIDTANVQSGLRKPTGTHDYTMESKF